MWVFFNQVDPFLDPYILSLLNHTLHTTVVPLLILELCTVYHIYPRRLSGMSSLNLKNCISMYG